MVKSWLYAGINDTHSEREAWRELEDYLRKGPSFPGNEPAKNDRSSLPKEIRQAYFDLELEPHASEEDIRRAYRRLLRMYHPDRFIAQEQQSQAAAEITRRISLAYKRLNDYYNY